MLLKHSATLTAPTLYRVQFDYESGKVIRCFLWHWNDTESSYTLKLQAKLGTGSADIGTVSASTRNVSFIGTQGDISIPGIELACIQQFGAFDDHPSPSFVNGEVTLWEHVLNSNRLVGALLEFDLETSAEVSLLMRTIALGDDVEEPGWDASVSTAGSHIRGTWPSANIQLPVSTALDADPLSTARYAVESGFVQRIKTESSYPLLPSLEPFEKSQLEAQAGLNRRKFWMRSFRGIPLKTDRSFWQTIRYVHANPVKAGLVDDAENYRWSSASMFLKQWWHPEDGLIVPDDYWDQTLLNRDKRRR